MRSSKEIEDTIRVVVTWIVLVIAIIFIIGWVAESCAAAAEEQDSLSLNLSHSVPVPASAPASPDAWTKTDTGFQIAYAALHIVDWGQTLNISKSGDRWRETNPILGPHPKQSTVNMYFAGTLAAHTAIAYLLPKDWRRVWQMVWIGIETGYVYKNFELGIGVRF